MGIVKKKNNNKSLQKTDKKPLSPKTKLIIAIASFLSVVLVFGMVLGISVLIKNKNAVARYGTVRADRGVVSYLVSSAKRDFIADIARAHGISAVGQDTPEFWNETVLEGRPLSEHLTEYVEEFVRDVIAGAYLFDRYASLSRSERTAIKRGALEMLEAVAEGNESLFNKKTAEMGFDFSDVVAATELLFKYERARAKIYGSNGEVLSSGSYLNECDEYYSTYTHALFIFIRTDDEFELDENGNRVPGDDGNDKLLPLDPSETEKRLADVQSIMEAIDSFEDGTDAQMTPVYFDSMLKKYSYDYASDSKGYYFTDGGESGIYSKFTKDFYEGYPEVVEAALSMSKNSYKCIELEDSYCVIYKTENENYAYTYPAYSDFFEDFYVNASYYLYDASLDAAAPMVVLDEEKYNKIDPVLLPYNSVYRVRVELDGNS